MRSSFLPVAVLVAIGVMSVSVGATADPSTAPEVAGPVEVTGTAQAAPCSQEPTVTTTDSGVMQHRGAVCHPIYTWSDPRLEGTVSWSQNADVDVSGLGLHSTAISIENDDGIWRARPTLAVTFPWSVETGTEVWLLVLDGEGAYEGLVAVIESTPHPDGVYTTRGFIIEGDFPPPPENASMEQG